MLKQLIVSTIKWLLRRDTKPHEPGIAPSTSSLTTVVQNILHVLIFIYFVYKVYVE